MATLEMTMRAHDTGEPLHRDIRPFVVSFGGEEETVDLPGWYPSPDGQGGESVHVGDDLAVIDLALLRIKKKLGLPSDARVAEKQPA